MDSDTSSGPRHQWAAPSAQVALLFTMLEPGQERSAAEALAASHAEYPAFSAVFPDPARRARALLAFFTATVRDAIRFGGVHAALDGSTVLGAAIWLPPGGFPWSARRQAMALPAFLRVLAADPPRFRTFIRYGTAAQRAHPSDDHWYLVALGVRPGVQRRGIGTELLAPVLHRASHDRTPCYLETSDRSNVAFYERFGFRTAVYELPLVPGGPAHVAMRREPELT